MQWTRIDPPAININPETFVLPDGDERAQLEFIGSRVENSSYSWRCCKCMTMQPTGSTQAWMEDGILPNDPAWSVKEKNIRNAWNGHFSAWCMGCAATLLPKENYPATHKELPVQETGLLRHKRPTPKSDRFIFLCGMGVAVVIETVLIALVKLLN